MSARQAVIEVLLRVVVALWILALAGGLVAAVLCLAVTAVAVGAIDTWRSWQPAPPPATRRPTWR